MDQVHVHQRGSRRRHLAPGVFESREDFGNAIFSLPLITDRITNFLLRAAIPGCSSMTPGRGSAAITNCNLGALQQIRINTTSPVAFRKLHSDSASRRPRAYSLRLPSFPAASSAVDLAAAPWLAFLSGTVSSVAWGRSTSATEQPALRQARRTTPITAWTTAPSLRTTGGETKLHAARWPEVGATQSSPRRRQPRLAAGARRTIGS